MRGLTGDHGKTDGYDVPDAYDATTPIFRRSTAAVEVKGMTGSTAPGGCRLSVEGGGQPATNPNLEKQAHRSTGGTHDVVHARDPFTVRQGTTLMTTLMRTNRTAVGPARRRYSTIRGGGFDSIWRHLTIVRAWRSLALRNLGSARDGCVEPRREETRDKGTKEQKNNDPPHRLT